MTKYDVIVLGTGGIGSAALAQLAMRGRRVLGLDRFPPAHDRGSSHGQTRMIREAYFEHPDYVPLVQRAYQLWAELEQQSGEALYRETGLLQIGPPQGLIVPGVLRTAAEHRLDVETLGPKEIERRFPGFRVNGMNDGTQAAVGLFERRAGYLRVEACVRAYLDLAVRRGAELRTGVAVQSWRGVVGGVEVEAGASRFRADQLLVTAGAWASELLLGLGLRLEVRRKPQYWYRASGTEYHVDRGAPAFLFETSDGLFYGFPQIDEFGVKMAEHSGGRHVADPLLLDRELDRDDQMRVEAFAARHMPAITREMTRHAPCMYTMTADENFIVDRHPEWPQVVFAAGLSGHGFKFAGVLGEALADLALEGKTKLPIGFLNCHRPSLRG